MKIEKYKKLRDNRYELIFDNDEKINLYDDVIVKYNLLSYNDIDEKLMIEIKKYNASKEAYYKALKYISRKIRAEKEIKKYLTKLEYDSNIITNTIKELKHQGYLNKDVFINAYVNDAINLSKKGPNKILKELIDLDFNDEDIYKYLDKIEDDIWLDRIEKLINKKVTSNRNKGARILKEKILTDLIILGYKKESIVSILDTVNLKNPDILKKEYYKIKTKLEKKYKEKELEYHIKNKLYQKGFDTEEIGEVINTND